MHKKKADAEVIKDGRNGLQEEQLIEREQLGTTARAADEKQQKETGGLMMWKLYGQAQFPLQEKWEGGKMRQRRMQVIQGHMAYCQNFCFPSQMKGVWGKGMV